MAKDKRKQTAFQKKEKYNFNSGVDKSTHGLMKEIFQGDEAEEKTDMTKMERKTRNWKKITLISAIVFLVLALGAAVLGFFVFNKESTFKDEGISLDYTGKAQAISGEDFVLSITFRNRENTSLTDQIIEVQYPAGFTYQSSNYGPSGQYNNQWSLPTLAAGQESTLEITGQIVGDIGTSRNFSAVWTYQPLNFSSEFRKTLDWEVVVASSTLELELDGSREVISDQETAYTLKLKNTSTRDLQRVKVTAEWPSGFELKSSEPSIDGDGWLYSELSAGDEEEIAIRGIFTGSPGDSKELLFKVGLVQSDGSTNSQLDESFIILLIEPQLQIQLSLNSEATSDAVEWGDTLVYDVELNNAGDVKLDDGQVTLVFYVLSEEVETEAELLDWSTLINPQEAERDNETLVWTADEVSGLESFKPGNTLSLKAEVNLISQPPSELVEKSNIALQAKVDYSAQRTSSNESNNLSYTTSSQPVLANILSEPTLSVEARYYDDSGEVVGLGALPPVVGETTVFKIYWTIKNTTNDLTQATVTATLPDSAKWIGQGTVNAGQPLSFDQSSRKITWEINKVPAFAGTFISDLTAEFSVSITPAQSQIGEYVLLLDKTVFRATDGFADETIVLSRDSQSTSLTADALAREKGRVIGRGD